MTARLRHVDASGILDLLLSVLWAHPGVSWGGTIITTPEKHARCCFIQGRCSWQCEGLNEGGYGQEVQ